MLTDPEAVFNRVTANLKNAIERFRESSVVAGIAAEIKFDVEQLLSHAQMRLPDGSSYMFESLRRVRDYSLQNDFGRAEIYWHHFLDDWRKGTKFTADYTPK